MALQQGVASAAFLAGSFWPFQAEHRTVAPTGLEATESCKGEYQKTSVVPFKNQRKGGQMAGTFFSREHMLQNPAGNLQDRQKAAQDAWARATEEEKRAWRRLETWHLLWQQTKQLQRGRQVHLFLLAAR